MRLSYYLIDEAPQIPSVLTAAMQEALFTPQVCVFLITYFHNNQHRIRSLTLYSIHHVDATYTR